jgi:hypothetical protein
VLRAERAKLDSRLQALVERHLALKPLNANQYNDLKSLPDRFPWITEIQPVSWPLHRRACVANASR